MHIRRLIKAGAAAVFALVVALLLLSAVSNALLPTRSEVVEHLSAADKARLAETVHLRQTLGDRVWPG